MAQSEFDIIRRYFSMSADGSDSDNDSDKDNNVILGVGDDAAIIESPDRPLVVATDTLVEGVHFPAGFPAQYVASRVLGVNLSDFAAMGATPRWLTMAISLPGIDHNWLAKFSQAFGELCRHYQLSLVGGDTTRAPLSITLSVIGEAGGNCLKRSGACAGDDVWVSGELGKGAAALYLLDEAGQDGQWACSEEEKASLLQSFYAPQPRLALGSQLTELASSAIDISDGLLADAGHIAGQSGVDIYLEADQLPICQALAGFPDVMQARRWVCSGGDDYELLFTASPAHAKAIHALSSELDIGLRRIGQVTARQGEEPEVVLAGEAWPNSGSTGYSHF